MWRHRPLGVESLLTVDSQYLQLGADVRVDWHTATDLIEQLMSGTVDPQLVTELLPLLRAGELLDKWTEPWVAAERDRYHAMRMRAFDVLGHAADHQASLVSCKAIRTAHSRHAAAPKGRDVGDWRDR